MEKNLKGKRVAILVDRGFEQVELTEPRRALEHAGATTALISPEERAVRAWNFVEWGGDFDVDLAVEEARSADFDALLLPGGVMNPDRLRLDSAAVQLVRAFFDDGKPIASICHGPWTLIEAGVVAGRTLTSWPSLRTDLINAGATWLDEEVVSDRGLVTSRRPEDIPAFNRKMIEVLAAAGRGQRAA